MSQHLLIDDPEAQATLAELQRLIRARFPTAAFRTRVAPDGRIFLDAYTDTENDFAVLELVAEQTVDFMIAHHRSIHVFPRCRA
jgi:hypothetical protein